MLDRNKLRRLKRETKNLLRNFRDTIFYRLNRERHVPNCLGKVVFVCQGNICRSVFAEYLMKAQTQGAQVAIESCGLMAGDREPSPREARFTAKVFGLDLDGHFSKGWECCNLAAADLILAMEYWQFRTLVELFPHKKKNIKLLREFAPFPESLFCNIDDPFGQNEQAFEKCFKQIERSVVNINRMYRLT